MNSKDICNKALDAIDCGLLDPTAAFFDEAERLAGLCDSVLSKNCIFLGATVGLLPTDEQALELDQRFDDIILKAFGCKERVNYSVGRRRLSNGLESTIC